MSVASVDLHLHSTCSIDGESSIEAYARQAVKLGLNEIGFCEHVDLDPRNPSYNYLNPAEYERQVATARAAVPNVRLRRGIEITYQASLETEIRMWLAPHDWDYVMTSVHLVEYDDGWAMVSEPGVVEAYFASHTPRQSYLPYFEELHRAVASHLGDLLGHLDLVKRYGTAHYGAFEPAIYEEEIRSILRAAVESGIGLEINASGLRQGPREPYPGLQILRWYRELGGEILTVGSDAHHVRDLGAGLQCGADLARRAGFTALTTFVARQPHWIDL